MAPDAELAVHYAREMFGRRNESIRLWVVRRADIHDLEDPDLLQPPLDRSFKKPGGYVMRDKLAAARERPASEAARRRATVTTIRRRRRSRRRAAGDRDATRSTSCCCRWPTTSSSSASPIPSGPASRRSSRRTWR